MLERILVPLDGSKRAENIIPFARELALHARGEIVLAHVTDPEVPLTSSLYTTHLRRMARQAKAQAEAYLETLAEELRVGGVPTRVYVAIGPAARRLLSVAEGQGVGLIALTARGGGGEDTVLGTIAARVLRLAKVPVFLVRPGVPQQAGVHLSTAVVPLDGSVLAEQALPVAAELAQAMDLAIHLVQVVPTPRHLFARLEPEVAQARDSASWEQAVAQDAQRYLRQQADGLSRSVGDVSTATLRGEVVAALLDHAGSLPAPVLVLTTAGGRGMAGRWQMGRTG